MLKVTHSNACRGANAAGASGVPPQAVPRGKALRFVTRKGARGPEGSLLLVTSHGHPSACVCVCLL